MEAPIGEKISSEAGALDALQMLLGDDLIGIDVLAMQRRHDATVFAKGLHVLFPVLPSTHVDKMSSHGCGRCNCGTDQVGSAFAALRARMAGFIPRHIEQPGSRHCAPASVKMRSRPSRSAACFTASEPGTTRTVTPLWTL